MPRSRGATLHGARTLALAIATLALLANAVAQSPSPAESDPSPPPVRSGQNAPAKPSPRSARWGRLRDSFLNRARWQQDSDKSSSGSQDGSDNPLATSAAATNASTEGSEADQTIPKAERGGTGAQPTLVQEIEQGVSPYSAIPAPTPLYLNKFLGLEDQPYRTFGWIQNTYTGNANGTPKDRSNFSVFPNRLANQWQGDQYYLVLENPLEPDDMVNFGFRFDFLFGNDWQFTKAYGLFDNAFPNNHFAGIDLPQIFGEVHLPILTPGGLDLKGGRFYSPAGFSAVPIISRPFVTVPYSMNFTPFSFFGAMGTFHLTDRINLIGGTINGFDRWIDESYKWGYMGFVTWKSRDAKTNIVVIGASAPDQLPRFPSANTPFVPTATTPPNAALAGQPNPYYASSYREFVSLVVTRQWTPKFTEVIETDHIYDPKIIGFSQNGKPSSIDYHGLVHWYLYTWNEQWSGGWRSEIFWDPYGAATGSRGVYYEESLAVTYKPKDWLWIRPELRYDWSQFTHPFSDNTRSGQFTWSIATILLF